MEFHHGHTDYFSVKRQLHHTTSSALCVVLSCLVLSRLPSLCCVLLVFLSLDVLSVLGHQIIAIRCILLLTPVNSARLCELLWCLSDGVDTKEAHKDVHDVMWC